MGIWKMEKKNSEEKEIQQLKKRFHDLADKSFRQGVYTYTGFLGLGDQELFWQEEPRLKYAGYELNGGFEGAERVLVRFGAREELGYEEEFPIACLLIRPLARKFADDLSHRDFLGALTNLGIERSILGDIRVGEGQACLFCLRSIAEFICENLVQVKRTSVTCSPETEARLIPGEEPEKRCLHVPSLRADVVLARVYDMSREKSAELFRTGKVYISGRRCENHSRQLKTGETVNARGYGKFVLVGEPRETRKGRLTVEAEVYR